jgi:hypothetical protein
VTNWGTFGKLPELKLVGEARSKSEILSCAEENTDGAKERSDERDHET